MDLVSWLSAHSPEQVVLLLGNHELSRVSELARFSDDAAFALARAEADRAYRLGDVDLEAQSKLLEAYPFVADAETLARDSSTFTTEQGRLVDLLLRSGRFRLAFEHQGLLLVHAGVTHGDLDAAGVDASSAAAAAAGLNAFLDERVAAWITFTHDPSFAVCDVCDLNTDANKCKQSNGSLVEFVVEMGFPDSGVALPGRFPETRTSSPRCSSPRSCRSNTTGP